MHSDKRKRIQCRGSDALESTGASPTKTSTVEDAGGEEARSRRDAESTREPVDDDAFSGNISVSSSSDDSAFTQGSATGCGSCDTGFLSAGGQEGTGDMRGESGSSEAETSGKAVDETTGSYCEDYVPCALDMRLRRIKNVDPNSPVSNVRNLLSTGLLEGLPVTYHSDSYKVSINGFIKDLGYLCGCSSCKYTKVLSALDFEKHSGAASKNQNNHILLENGKSLYNVVKELSGAGLLLGSLQSVIEEVIGCPPNWKLYKAWKESFQIENHGVQNFCQKVVEGKSSQPNIHHEDQIVRRSNSSSPEYTQESRISAEYAPATPKASSCRGCSLETQISSSRKSKGRTPATRSTSRSSDLRNTPEATTDNPNTQPSSSAKACSKKRDSILHRVIFTENGLPDGAELAYHARGKKVLDGYKLGSGILCNCCCKEISPSQFEAHSGWGRRRQPYRHIYTSNGVSLHDLSISLSKGQRLTSISSDDECSICGEGGELVFCARCPKAIHLDCSGLSHIPEGEWCCTHCKDKLPSGVVATNAQMAVRVRRIIVAPSVEFGCCSICRRNNFSCSDSFNEETVLICDQCEKEYHVGCLRSSGLCDLQDLPEGNWYCCSNCMLVHDCLREIASHGVNIVPDILTSQLKVKLQEKCLMNEAGFDVRWQLLSGKIPSHLNKLLLSKALEIFDEGFEPIIERSGRNLIPPMVYGINIGGHELVGMYCAILTVNSVVVSAGIIRIFGNEVAEMPLVATKHEDQGKGYFGCLFSCIEMLLRNLRVETLILPAMENVESMWTHKFGFRKMPEDRFQNLSAVLPLMMFRGTKMLEKPVLTG